MGCAKQARRAVDRQIGRAGAGFAAAVTSRATATGRCRRAGERPL